MCSVSVCICVLENSLSPPVSTEAKVDLSSEEQTEMLRKVVTFLEDLAANEAEKEKHYQFANKVDKIIAWLYLIVGVVYFICMIVVMVKYKCAINHFDFWYELPQSD